MTMQFDDLWFADPSAWIAFTWIGWGLSWLLASFWSRRAAARAGVAELPSLLISALGFYGVLAPHIPEIGPDWDAPPPLEWLMAAAVVAGAAFAWWGRAHLGALWSGTVTRKHDHRIVDSGPYAIVRHPIYTGLIGAGFATAVVRGHFLTLLGACLLALGFFLKAKLEEGFLSVDLGAEYDAYRKRVPMLIPFAPH